MNNTEKRQGQLMELLSEETAMSVKDLAQQMHVSVTTVRKDLADLEERHYVKVGKGIVSINSGLPIARDLITNPRGKRRIAAEAASLVSDGDSLFVNAGPCCVYLVEELIARQLSFHLLTNSLYLCTLMGNRPGVDVYLTGGRYNSRSNSIAPPSLAFLPSFTLDLCIAEVGSYQTGKGFTPLYEEEEELLFGLSSRATQTVALVDSSSSPPPTQATAIATGHACAVITDKRPSEFVQADLRENHIRLVMV